MCDVSSCTTLTVCHRPLLRSWCVYIYLQLNVIQQVSLCVQTRLSVLMFASAVRVTICAKGSEEKTATLQVRLQVVSKCYALFV